MSLSSYDLFNIWGPVLLVGFALSFIQNGLWELGKRRFRLLVSRYFPGVLDEVALDNRYQSRAEAEGHQREVFLKLDNIESTMNTHLLVQSPHPVARANFDIEAQTGFHPHYATLVIPVAGASAAEETPGREVDSINSSSKNRVCPLQEISEGVDLTPCPINFLAYFSDGTTKDVTSPIQKLLQNGAIGPVRRIKSSIILQASLPMDPWMLAEIVERAKYCMPRANQCTFQLGSWGILYYKAGQVLLHKLKEGDVPMNVEARWQEGKAGITMRGLYLTGCQIKVGTERTSRILRSAGPATQGAGDLDELHLPIQEGDIPAEGALIYATRLIEVDGIALVVRSEASLILPPRRKVALIEAVCTGWRRISNSALEMLRSLFMRAGPCQTEHAANRLELDPDPEQLDLHVEHWKGLAEIELFNRRNFMLVYLQELRASEIIERAGPPSCSILMKDEHDCEYWRNGLRVMNEAVHRNPNSHTTIRVRGGIQLLLGDFESALQDYDLAVLKMKGHPSNVLLERAILKCMLGRHSEAMQDVTALMTLNPSANGIRELQLCIQQILDQQGSLRRETQADPLCRRPLMPDQEDRTVEIPDLITGDEWNSGESESSRPVTDDDPARGLIFDSASDRGHSEVVAAHEIILRERVHDLELANFDASSLRQVLRSLEDSLRSTEELNWTVEWPELKIENGLQVALKWGRWCELSELENEHEISSGTSQFEVCDNLEDPKPSLYIAGTGLYTAPFKVREGRKGPLYSDAWSFGTKLTEILSRKVPYSDLDLASSRSRCTNLRPSLPNNCPTRELTNMIEELRPTLSAISAISTNSLVEGARSWKTVPQFNIPSASQEPILDLVPEDEATGRAGQCVPHDECTNEASKSEEDFATLYLTQRDKWISKLMNIVVKANSGENFRETVYSAEEKQPGANKEPPCAHSLGNPRAAKKILEGSEQNPRELLHPNIDTGVLEKHKTDLPFAEPRVYDPLFTDECSVVEFLEGSKRRTEDIWRQILADMRVALDQVVIHRDLKPSNILLRPLSPPFLGPLAESGSSVKLKDFGRSECQIQSSDGTTLMCGTSPWRAPEIFKARELSLKADVYSFGMTCYEILSGSLPFEKESNRGASLLARSSLANISQRNVPEDLIKLIQQCSAINPAQRPPPEYIVRELRKWPAAKPREYDPRFMIDSIAIMFNITKAMADFHGCYIAHRDLKPSNILLKHDKSLSAPSLKTFVESGSAFLPCYCWERLADFEPSEIRSSDGKTLMCGTSFWRAPEIYKAPELRGLEDVYTLEADVYCFGMTCYEILTGNLPFETKSDRGSCLLAESLFADFTQRNVPEDLMELIKQCLAINPAERPTFDHIVRELRKCQVQAIAAMEHPALREVQSLQPGIESVLSVNPSSAGEVNLHVRDGASSN